MKTSRSLIALTVAALIPFAAALAGDSARKVASFETLDANSDGRISPTEAAVESKLDFSTADANDDGYLGRAEWEASLKASANPAPRSVPERPTDPSMPQASDPASTPRSDTEAPRR